jgi:hypothetical protein
MDQRVFCLSHVDGDWYFLGPKNIPESEFSKIVLNTLPAAAEKAMQVEESHQKTSNAQPNFITWRDVIKWIPELLEKAGFQSIKIRWSSLPHYDLMNFSNVPDAFLGSVGEGIKAHNKRTLESFREPVPGN